MESERSKNLFENNPTFCVVPWVGLLASIDGVWRRCCDDLSVDHHYHFHEKEKPRDMRLDPDALGCTSRSPFAADNPDKVFGIREAFNSPNLRRTRLAMLAGERTEACRYCYGLEALGGRSHRQSLNGTLRGRMDWDEVVAATSADGGFDRQPVGLDLRLGNQCNLTCIMCSYPTSSSWKSLTPETWLHGQLDPYREDDAFWREIVELLPGIRWLHFTGGEPMLLKSHHRMLDLVLASGYAANIVLSYNTNLTFLPPGIFAKFSQFKEIHFHASCDGVGETFEKIRRGAKWAAFVENLRIASRHLKPKLVALVQRDNVHNIPELVHFALAEGIELDMSAIIQYPRKLSLQTLSCDQAAQHIPAYDELARFCRDAGQERLAGEVDAVRSLLAAIAKG